MASRDANDLNGHSVVIFEDVIGEPDNVQSISCTWDNAKPCFKCSKNCCYILLSTLCGLPFTFYWALQFACLNFHMVWCYTPCIRYYEIVLSTLQKIFGMCIHCFCDPIFESISLCLNNIRVEKMGK